MFGSSTTEKDPKGSATGNDGSGSLFMDKKAGELLEIDLEQLSNQGTSGQGSQSPSEAEAPNTLKQSLKSRQIQLIAIGGVIGTGLFVGTSSTLHLCGPAPLFISYVIMSSVIYPIVGAIGEMVCYLPGDGHDSAGSMSHLVNRYVDPSLSFAVGWNYFYCFAILIAAECSAASGVVTYWTTSVPTGAWITIFLGVIVILNSCAVKFFGETEFWFAIIKVLTIIGLIILSFILFWGGGPNHDRLGFRYWKHPGAFAHHITGGSLGNFLDIYTAIIKGGFAFILGPELIAMTSSECQDQRRNIARASSRFVWRLVFFYILGALSISVIVAYNDPVLSNALAEGKAGAASSPFVIGIINAGIKVLPHIINACILTSAWSAGNAYMFAASRSLLTLATNGQAPRICARINRFGVPYVAIFITFLISCLAYLNVSSSTADVFNWFVNITTISGFIGWICGLVAYIRFRKAIDFNGLLERLPYKPKGTRYTVYWSLLVTSLVTLTNGYEVFIPKYWNVSNFVAAYVTIPIFLVLWIGHKLWSRNLRTWWYPVEKIDVLKGLSDIEEKTRFLDEERRTPNNSWEKFMDALF